MKLRDLYRINSRRGLLLSILFHVVIAAVLTTATLELTTPQGIVLSEEMEFGDTKSGLPIPVDIQNTVPKGNPEKREEKRPVEKPTQEDVVQDVPTDDKIETQNVEEKKETVEAAKNKAWVPVEQTDIDDSDRKQKSSDDNEVAEESAGLKESQATESKTDNTGEDFSQVRSEKELKVVSGAPYKWPFLQRVQRNEGTTVIRFTVNPDGTVDKVWVHMSSGHEALDRAAVEGHYKARYEVGIEGTFQKRVIWRLTGPAIQMPFRNKQ